MTTVTPITFKIDRLFADLEKDGIIISTDTIKQVENGDLNPIKKIGYEYDANKQKYDKAMAWYRLAAVQNDSWAQNSIGNLYYNGEGVPKDYFAAMEWYLKAAIGNNKTAKENIALCFEKGFGVPLDKYKALEWYRQSGNKPDKVKELIEQGIQLKQEDKDKPIKNLILETEDIFWQEKQDFQKRIIEERSNGSQLKTRIEEKALSNNGKINVLTEEKKGHQLPVANSSQRTDRQSEIIEHYKRKMKRMDTEIRSLKAKNTTQATQLELKAIHLKTLEKEIASLRIASERPIENTTKRLEEVERSNQNLEKLLKQERQLRENEIMLVKQQMEVLINKENNGKRKLKVESESMEYEPKRVKTSTTSRGSAGSNNANTKVGDGIGNREFKNDSGSSSDNGESDGTHKSGEKIKIETV